MGAAPSGLGEARTPDWERIGEPPWKRRQGKGVCGAVKKFSETVKKFFTSLLDRL